MRKQSVALVAALALAFGGGGCGNQAEESEADPVEFIDRPDGLRIDVPPDYHVVSRPLTGTMVPREVISIATFSTPRRLGVCTHMPARAVSAMGPDDALITIFETPRPDLSDPRAYPPRRGPLGFDADNGIGCVSRPGLRSSWTSFSESGRAFHALVVLGKGASKNTALEALNSFHATSPETTAHLSDGCQPAYLESTLVGLLGALADDDRRGALGFIAPRPELIGFTIFSGAGRVDARTPGAIYSELSRLIEPGERVVLLRAAVGAVAPTRNGRDDASASDPAVGVDYVAALGSRSMSGKAGVNCATGRIYLAAMKVVRGLVPAKQRVCGGLVDLYATEPVVCAYPPTEPAPRRR